MTFRAVLTFLDCFRGVRTLKYGHPGWPKILFGVHAQVAYLYIYIYNKYIYIYIYVPRVPRLIQIGRREQGSFEGRMMNIN